MDAAKVVRKLVHLYGDSVQVKSEYHIQVLSDKGPNDIWVKKDGSLKFKKYGDNKVHADISFDKLIRMIVSKKKTKVEQMTEMLDLATIVKSSEKASEVLGNAIFTDAGFKNGKARIATVMTMGPEITAKSLKDIEKAHEIFSIQDAERVAITYGLMMDKKLTVYNDNKTVCESMDNPRVKWLPREYLKAPDKLANLREA
jgi:hypothetical protein